MTIGIENMDTLEDILGHIIVTYKGEIGIVVGFTFEGDIIYISEGSSTEKQFAEIYKIVAIFGRVQDDILKLIRYDYSNRTHKHREYFSGDALPLILMESGEYRNALTLADELRAKPEDWRDLGIVPNLGWAIETDEPSVESCLVTDVWLTVSDDIKKKYTHKDGRYSVITTAAKMFVEKHGSENLKAHYEKSIPYEEHYLTGIVAPYNSLSIMKRTLDEMKREMVVDDVKQSLSASDYYLEKSH